VHTGVCVLFRSFSFSLPPAPVQLEAEVKEVKAKARKELQDERNKEGGAGAGAVPEAPHSQTTPALAPCCACVNTIVGLALGPHC